MEAPSELPGPVYDASIVFDPANPRHLRAIALIHAFDVWSQIEIRAYIPEESSEPMKLTTADGRVLVGHSLFQYVVRHLRLLWPVAILTWLPGVGWLLRSMTSDNWFSVSPPGCLN
jgi:hypothetical protein